MCPPYLLLWQITTSLLNNSESKIDRTLGFLRNYLEFIQKRNNAWAKARGTDSGGLAIFQTIEKLMYYLDEDS